MEVCQLLTTNICFCYTYNKCTSKQEINLSLILADTNLKSTTLVSSTSTTVFLLSSGSYHVVGKSFIGSILGGILSVIIGILVAVILGIAMGLWCHHHWRKRKLASISSQRPRAFSNAIYRGQITIKCWLV